MVAHAGTFKAPKGGLRAGGKFYTGNTRVPDQYRKLLSASTRPVDPAGKSLDAAPNYGRTVLPPVMRFSGMQTTLSRSYRASDEALRDSIQNAHMMLNDPMITEPLFQRMRMTALNEWHLEVPDDNDPEQKALKDELTKMLENVPHFMQYRYALLFAIWFGRYAVEHTYKQYKTPEGYRRYGIKGWTPVDGDKLVFRYDDGRGLFDPDQIGIRVSAALAPVDRIAGTRQLEPTADGLAYFLEPWERRFYTIHKHIIIDGHWEDPLSAGKINGTGVRSFLYWLWYQKQEALAQLSEIVEISASGVWIYWYPAGNDKAKKEVANVAHERAHTNVILMPRDPEVDQYGVEQIPFNAAGVEVLERLIREHFGHLIKRLILGQTLSSEADATGLGSGLADLQSDTMRQIVKFDSINLQETITTDLLWELRDRNFPHQRDIDIQFKIDTDTDDPGEILDAAERMWNMGADIGELALMEKAGLTPPKPGDKVLTNPVIEQQTRLTEQHQAQQEAEGGQPQDDLLGGLMADAGGDVPPEGGELPGEALPEEQPGEEVPEPFDAGGGAQRGPVMHAKPGKQPSSSPGQRGLFDEEKHPRAAKGEEGGGRFTSGSGAGGITSSRSVKVRGDTYPAVPASDLKDGMTYWDGSTINDVAVSPNGKSVSFTFNSPQLNEPVEVTKRAGSLIAMQGDVKENEPANQTPRKPRGESNIAREAKAQREIRGKIEKLSEKLTDMKFDLTEGRISNARYQTQRAAMKPQLDDLRDELEAIKPQQHAKPNFAYRYFRGGNYHVQPSDDGLVISQG